MTYELFGTDVHNTSTRVVTATLAATVVVASAVVAATTWYAV